MWPIIPTSHLQINPVKSYLWVISEPSLPSARNPRLDWMILSGPMSNWVQLWMAPDTKLTLARLSKSVEESMITSPEEIRDALPPLSRRNKGSKQLQGNLPALIAWYPTQLLISKRYSKGDSMKLHMFPAEISLLITTWKASNRCLSHLTQSKWVHVNRNRLFRRIGRVGNMSRLIAVCMGRVPKLHSIILINLPQESTQAMADLTLQIAKSLSCHQPWNQETLMEKALAWLDPPMKIRMPVPWKRS